MQNKMKLLLKSGHNVFNMDDLRLVRRPFGRQLSRIIENW
jgi:hypothetical protein